MFKELKENEIKKDGDLLSLSDIVKLDKENIKHKVFELIERIPNS